MTRGLLRRLRRGERGFVLPVALGIMVVLAISVTTAIYYTTQGQRSAGYSKGKQLAFTLAEAGMNNANSVLNNSTNNSLTQLIPKCKNNPQSNWNRTDLSGGYTLWCGDLDLVESLWELKSIGFVRSPNNASAIQHTLKARVVVVPKVTKTPVSQAWNYMFATATGSACDMTLNNGVTQSAALYVMGNLCLNGGSNPSKINGGPLVVKGNVTMATTGNTVGTSTTPISEAHIGGSCKWASQVAHTPCTSVDHVYATILDNTPPAIAVPAVDQAGWYANAAPGPKIGCATSSGTPPVFDNNSVMDNSAPTFNLTPASSYLCRIGPASNPDGELSWDAPSKTLTVRGTIFIDGSATVGNGAVNQYNGQATLYLSGSFTLSSSSKLCGGISGTNCDYGVWNPNTEMLTVVAMSPTSPGVQLASSAQFEGSLYATKSIDLGANAKAEGPMVGSTINLNSTTTTYPFGTINVVPVGQPGNGLVFMQPNPPERFSG